MSIRISTWSFVETILAILLMLIFCIYFYPTENSEIRIHDVFDGNFPTRDVLIKSGKFFSTNPEDKIPGIMQGSIPRGAISRFTEPQGLFMYFFGSLTGFALYFLVVRFTAFIGIYLFGRDHLQIKPEQKGLLFLTATLFACLPTPTIHGLTVLGLPLVFWAFYNLLQKKKVVISMFCFFLFAISSNFVLVGVHTCLVIGCIALFNWWQEKKFPLIALTGVFLMGVFYILSDYMMLYLHSFSDSYNSSRGEFEKSLALNFKGVIGNSFKVFFSNDYSAANYFGYLLLPFIVFYLWMGFRKKDDVNKKNGFLFFVICLLSSVIVSLLDWSGFAIFYEVLPFAKQFNFKRFICILPGCFFILTLVTLLYINRNNNLFVRAFSMLVILAFFVFIWRGNISFNRSAFDTKGAYIISNQKVTFRDFFDKPLYSSIKNQMGSDTVNNVIHFGLTSPPSKYAGLNVLDDYQGDYPKEYKAKFRKIIEGELDKSEKYKKYFDGWGIRCYIFSSGYFNGKTEYLYNTPYEPELSINTKQIKEMNANYILSGYIIGNANALNLKLEKVFVSYYDFKKILLYKINIS